MEEKHMAVDVIIPSYKPDDKFYECVRRLEKQTVKPEKIIILNTEEQYLNQKKLVREENIQIIHIKKEEFDHGGTRNYAASLSDAEVIVFMTQDAVPMDKHLIEYLTKPFEKKEIGASYARQTAGKEAGVIEQFTRQFNYPEEDRVKSAEDLETLGIKTYFCSNACAAYRNSLYRQLGGFVTKTIFNEDMIMASKIIDAGYSIAYASKAKVLHTHKYTCWQQFTRNFDLAVSQRQYKEIFSKVKSESEGIRLVKETAKHLVKTGKIYLIPNLILQSGFKFLGYQLGKRYERLPLPIIRRCSMNKDYWTGGKKRVEDYNG